MPHRRTARDDLRFFVRTTSTALRSLRRNAMRSALTTLGIIIGVGSLLAIAEIGKGAWSAIRTLLTKTGVDNIVVQAGAASRNGVSLGSGSIKTLTPEDAETILHECPSVDSLAPLVFTRRQVVHGNKNWVPSTFVGTTPGYLRVREWEDLDQGESFTERDVHDVAMVCLLGQTVARELFDEQSPVGQEVYVNDVPLRVIGVLSPQGGRHHRRGSRRPARRALDDGQVPGERARRRPPAKRRDALGSDPDGSAQSDGAALPPPTRRSVSDHLSDAVDRHPPAGTTLQRRFDPGPGVIDRGDPGRDGPDHPRAPRTSPNRAGEPADFAVRDFTEVVHAVKGTVGLVAGLLLCVALISLLVGGIGIMNIMLLTVTERYREIGLRMAVGARSRDILRQFLVEAVVLCVLGGAVGIAAGRGASVLVRLLARWPTEPSLHRRSWRRSRSRSPSE